jgi:hypothetical protein
VSITQVIFAAALGSILGQGVLYSMGHLVGWIQRDQVGGRIRKLVPWEGSALIAGFIKYAGVLGASVALIILGVWAVEDYLAARSARSVARASLVEAPTVQPTSIPQDSTDKVAGLTPVSDTNSPTAVPADNVDPYSDPEFQVQRRPHRAGVRLSLKESLLQRSEAKARDDLLREVRQHVQRSQYDCEAAERASKYLEADLDVWGFAAWQVKHFPIDSYEGATLPQCKDIESLVVPSGRVAANSRG